MHKANAARRESRCKDSSRESRKWKTENKKWNNVPALARAMRIQVLQDRMLRGRKAAQDFRVAGTMAPHRDDLRHLGVGNSAAHQFEQSGIVNPQISQRTQ